MKSIKTCGLAAAMALALIAMLGATSASANVFKSTLAETNWNGSLTGKNHVLSLDGESFSCSKVSFSGSTLVKAANYLTVTPELAGCSWSGSQVSWSTNGCKFRFHPGGPGETLVGSVDIVNCTSPMSFEYVGCKLEIGKQNGIGTVQYENSVESGKKIVTFVANLGSITFTRTGAACNSQKGTFSNGTYTGLWKVKGAIPGSGSQVDVEVESAALPSPTMFAAEEGPVTIAGSNEGGKRFSPLGGNGLVCKNYTVSGTMAAATAESITVTPTYKNCTVGGWEVLDTFVSAGSCSYVFRANGKIDIAGANCASNPMAFTRPGCVATVGPQSGISGFSFTNEGSGKLRTVTMSGTSPEKSITYSLAGSSCGASGPGTYSDGRLWNTIKLTATNSSGQPQGISVE